MRKCCERKRIYNMKFNKDALSYRMPFNVKATEAKFSDLKHKINVQCFIYFPFKASRNQEIK